MHKMFTAAIGSGALAAILAAPASSGVFGDQSVLELTIEAPFSELLTRAESDDDYAVTGTLTWPDASGAPRVLDDVAISERGHTSRRSSECDFPKLKLNLAASTRNATPFEGIGAVKLGTHCGDRPDDELTPKFGRLANEHAPQRETLVYQILHAAEVPTLLARAARVTYVFTDGPSRPPLTRAAMLLEDDDEAMKRVSGVAAIAETAFGSAREQIDEGDTARLAFAEAMIGNFDWCLRMFPGDIYRCDERHPLWNVLAFTRADGRVVPLMYDFDISGPVAGRHVWFPHTFEAGFAQPPSPIVVEVLAQVQRTRSLFARARLDQTRAHFLRMRNAVMQTIERATVDERGRTFAREYVEAFYHAIETDAEFYRPIVVAGGHTAFLDAEGARPACGTASLIPAGTPVTAPLEVRGGMQRVRLLDTLWEWTGNNQCDIVHREPVWVDAQAIGTDYPR